MDFCKNTNALNSRRVLFEGACEQPVDSDITLPEYFPDVVRVLKCTLTPRITSVQGTADRITAEGSALLRILYLSEENCVRCFEQNIPFSKYAECKAAENACVSAHAKTGYVNCRVQSPRRIDIHGSISIAFSMYCRERTELLCGCTGGGVQMRKMPIAYSNLAGCSEKLFSMHETLELGAAKPSIAQIVKCDAAALLEDVKLVAGKALVKGELIVRTLYIADNEESDIQTMEHSMPISQIIEIDGAEEECTADAVLTVSALEIAAKTDATGALRLLDTSVYLCAQISLYAECESDVITDAYSTQYEIDLLKRSVEFRSICDRFSDTYLCRGTPDTAGSGIAQIVDMTCQELQYSADVQDNALRIQGTVRIGLLYRDRENQWGFTDRSFDFTYTRAVAATGEHLLCQPHITVSGVSFLLGTEDKVDARVELDISGIVFSAKTVQAVSDIQIDEENRKRQKHAALTIYFAQEGESVWEIARRYNTTSEAITAENKLTGDTVETKCKLLIPRV